MTTIEERTAFLENPFFTKPLYGNFSPFYVTIAICTVIGVFLFVLNVVIGCCSRHSEYWQDRHTGNRWLVSLWTATPHKQPPIDLTELKDAGHFYTPRLQDDVEYISEYVPAQHHREQARQHHHHHHHPSQHHEEEFVELQKRESDI